MEHQGNVGNMGKKSYGKSYVTQLFSAADNGGCGKSTYIGRGGEPVKNQAFNTALNYPFILTYNNAKATPLDADAEAAMKNAGSKDTFDGAVFDGADQEVNQAIVAANMFSMVSQKQALHHAQGAFWMCIVVVQWADLIICKTRWLSIAEQGMGNTTMNFGLFFETLLAAWLAYFMPFNLAVGTRNIRVTHWFPAMPFSMLIFGYDEARKFLMRATSPVEIDKATGRQIRHQGWLERNTYY